MKKFTKFAVTSLFLACASTGYAAGSGQEGSLCIPVDGTVTATPIYCELIRDSLNQRIKESYQKLCPDGNNCLDSCLSISGKGKAKIKGGESFSVLTTVPSANQSGALPLMTPLGFPPLDASNARAGLIMFTSSASLTGKLETGQQGTLYTQDTGVITRAEPGQPQIVGQVLKIVDGTEDFSGATGTIAVAGPEVGGAAFYTGEICVKLKK